MRSILSSRRFAGLVMLVLAPIALAYPDKPVQYIIPFAPGGESDVAARLQQATEPWSILCGERTVANVRTGFEFGSVLG